MQGTVFNFRIPEAAKLVLWCRNGRVRTKHPLLFPVVTPLLGGQVFTLYSKA